MQLVALEFTTRARMAGTRRRWRCTAPRWRHTTWTRRATGGSASRTCGSRPRRCAAWERPRSLAGCAQSHKQLAPVFPAAATLSLRRLQAKADGKTVRALVVINPGNPTGGVLAKGNQVCMMPLVCGCCQYRARSSAAAHHSLATPNISVKHISCSSYHAHVVSSVCLRRLTLYGFVRRRTWF
jgi:hypothetical protein